MTDYISREAVVKSIEEVVSAMGTWISDYQAQRRGLMTAINIVEDIPAADVRPVVRGKWIPDYDYAECDWDGSTLLPEPRKFQDGWQCSLCGGYMPSETNFCPNCGADMMEES